MNNWTLLPSDRIQDERGNTIADLRYAANQSNCGNKYLIAAAPELLEALRDIVTHMRSVCPELCGGPISLAEAAIKKATNE